MNVNDSFQSYRKYMGFFSISYLWCKSVLIIQPPKLGNTRYSAGPKQCLAIKKIWAGGGVIIVMGEGKKISTVFSFLLSLPCAPPKSFYPIFFSSQQSHFLPIFLSSKRWIRIKARKKQKWPPLGFTPMTVWHDLCFLSFPNLHFTSSINTSRAKCRQIVLFHLMTTSNVSV